MGMKRHWLCVAVVIFLTAPGCRPKEEKAGPSRQSGAMSPPEIAAVIDALTRGMREVPFDSLAAGRSGQPGVVIARTAGQRPSADGAPPPRGMVRIMGQTTIYRGEIQAASSGTLTIRAAYPTSGRYKVIEIPQADIQSIYLAQ
jgi:hypothetical protein